MRRGHSVDTKGQSCPDFRAHTLIGTCCVAQLLWKLRAGFTASVLLPDSQLRVLSHSVMSDSLRPHGLKPARSSVHGILQARVLEQVAMPDPPEDLPDPGTEPTSPVLPAVSHVAGGFFTN